MRLCPVCTRENPPDVEACRNCAGDLTSIEATPGTASEVGKVARVEAGTQTVVYGPGRVISYTLKVVGLLVLIFGIAGSVLLGIEAGQACEDSLGTCDATVDGITVGAAFGVSSLIGGLLLLAIAEGLDLLMTIAAKD